MLGRLSASGFHTCSILMKLLCDSFLLETASQGGTGVDQVRWLKPVCPDDTLHGVATVIAARPSKSRPAVGVVTFNYELFNDCGEAVLTMKSTGLIDRAKPQVVA